MDMQVFEYEGTDVRTVEIDGEPWFIGRDVAEVLGYSNASKAISDHVDEDDKGVTKRYTLGGSQGMTVINESGLYSLILSSKLPDAKKFKKWVTSEVLPSIRKHEAYITPNAVEKMLADPDTAIRLLNEIKAEREKRTELESVVATQQLQLEEAKPKVTYYDLVLQSKDCISVNKIAKDYGRSAIWLNQYLSQKGVQYKQSGVWLLYQKYADEGYTSTKTFASPATDGYIHSHVTTYWTQKGRLFIYNLLKEDGYLPSIEKAKEPERESLAYTEVEDTGISQ